MSEYPDRARYTVLVPEAQAIGMIGVIRSLGRAGYRVHAASSRNNALGFKSRYCAISAVHPEYSSPEFASWLDSYIDKEKINAIIPSEGFLHACADCYDRIKEFIPDAVERDVWRRCMSKMDTYYALSQGIDSGMNLPQTCVVSSPDDIPRTTDIADDCGPFYVKADARLAKYPAKGSRVIRCTSLKMLRDSLADILREYEAVVFQHHVPGKKVGVSLWRHKGVFCAENMTLGIHMYPWHGGMMSLRRTFWHDRLLEDAKRKMEALNWQGVAMMEYTWNVSDDSFYFIEINARYWGYLHLDLYSGKDFPLLQVDAFFGHEKIMLGPPGKSTVCRYTIPGETGYLLSRLSSRELSKFSKLISIADFLVRFANPFTRSDLYFPGDRSLYWIEALRFMRDFVKPNEVSRP